MPVINIEVGSAEWLAMRKEKITSTDASIINGTNTFGGNCPRKLWERKLGLIPAEYVNDLMIEGTRLEEEAREWYNGKYDTAFEPQVVLNDKYDWAMASLDGFYEDSILEIKCGKKAYEQAQAGTIPLYYFDQIQHAMFCKGVRKAVYCAYRPDQEAVVIKFEAEKDYMTALLEKESDFYFNNLVALKPPEPSEEMPEPITDDAKLALSERWAKAKTMADAAKLAEKEAKEQLLEGLEGRKYVCGNVRIGWTVKRGDIDWKQVSDKLGISQEDLDSCRRKSSSFFTLKRV